MVLKNTYAVDLVNGETTPFRGWRWAPDEYVEVVDKWTGARQHIRFGAIDLGDDLSATVAVEEMHDDPTVGKSSLAYYASRWARRRDLLQEDKRALPHLHVNFGYAYTAHKSQGSQWPYVLVIIEPSVKMQYQDGQRWAYTAITRAQRNTAVFFGEP